MASYETRGKVIRAVVRLPGGGKKTGTFDTKVEAVAWAEKMEKKKALETLSPHAATDLTVGEAFEAYLDAVASKTDTGKWNRMRIMNWMSDPLVLKKLSSVITHDINEWIGRRLNDYVMPAGVKKISNATVNREMNLMSGAFSYFVKDRKWIENNPCHGARRPPETRPRSRPLLSPSEIESLCIATGYVSDPLLRTKTARVGAAFLLSLETGIRSGELLRCRPEDYWDNLNTLHVSATETGGRKGGKSGMSTVDPSRNVPLTARAKELIEQLLNSMPTDQESRIGQAHPPYIVGLSDSQRDSLWRKSRDKSGVKNMHFHDLKHEACTRLARFLDPIALSHAVGTKDLRLLQGTYYSNDAQASAALLPASLSTTALVMRSARVTVPQ